MVEKVGGGLLWSTALTCSLLLSRTPFLPESGGCRLPAVLTFPGLSSWHSHWTDFSSAPVITCLSGGQAAPGAREHQAPLKPKTSSPGLRASQDWLVVGRDA